jgi:hypothetical protein
VRDRARRLKTRRSPRWSAELALEAGSRRAFNVVTGEGPTAGAAPAAHPGIDKVAFTGSTAVGKRTARPRSRTRPALARLGGKSPVIVLDDVDPPSPPAAPPTPSSSTRARYVGRVAPTARGGARWHQHDCRQDAHRP